MSPMGSQDLQLEGRNEGGREGGGQERMKERREARKGERPGRRKEEGFTLIKTKILMCSAGPREDHALVLRSVLPPPETPGFDIPAPQACAPFFKATLLSMDTEGLTC